MNVHIKLSYRRKFNGMFCYIRSHLPAHLFATNLTQASSVSCYGFYIRREEFMLRRIIIRLRRPWE